MSKAMRQKFVKAKRASVVIGEAGGDLARDETCGPQCEIEIRSGSYDLNFSNRPVRTRMPGGVAGARSGILVVPMPICFQVVLRVLFIRYFVYVKLRVK